MGSKLTLVSNGGGPGGPEDKVLERRVEALERAVERIDLKIDRIDEALRRIEDALKALAADGVDLRKQVHELGLGLARVEGRIAAVEGRFTGIEGRLSMIPTVWQTIAIVATLLIGLSGIIFATGKFLHP